MNFNKKYFIYLGIIVILITGIIWSSIINNNSNEVINDNIALLDEDIIVNNTNDDYFYVDVKGEVKNPGVYKVIEGMIVNDVINLAGGLTKNAYTKSINLASKVTEGSVIYVYSKKDMTTTSSKTTTTNKYNYVEPNTNEVVNNNSGLVNINTASKEELLTITGIGESKADQIIEYRKSNPFKSIEDIMNVSGI
nr:SLBB domain-containing protein [Bacilli bacterium]